MFANRTSKERKNTRIPLEMLVHHKTSFSMVSQFQLFKLCLFLSASKRQHSRFYRQFSSVFPKKFSIQSILSLPSICCTDCFLQFSQNKNLYRSFFSVFPKKFSIQSILSFLSICCTDCFLQFSPQKIHLVNSVISFIYLPTHPHTSISFHTLNNATLNKSVNLQPTHTTIYNIQILIMI